MTLFCRFTFSPFRLGLVGCIGLGLVVRLVLWFSFFGQGKGIVFVIRDNAMSD